jgi:16S rRNA G966 N2-methylase RsmD
MSITTRYDKIYYDRLFPKIDKYKYKYLQIDQETISYITTPNTAKQILKIIINYFFKLNLNLDSIVDCTACVGGDSICLSSAFKNVYSVEIDKKRFDMLTNNINIYELKNITLINDDCLNALKNINYVQAMYFDPPWGGNSYHFHDNLRLTINNISIEQICIDLMNKKYTIKPPKFIIFKLPKNYDIHYFFKTVSYKEEIDIYLHKLEKMYLIVVINKYQDHEFIMIE